ncbi:MAG TPA: PPOX class F420-dependent oxidoreductase [Dehalococcoidia bacterium]|nr:PPOX class F420-dependent oxidoreductase [Dehalococcoidia bacterium]
MTEQELDEFLSAPRVAVLSTVDAQGRPRQAAIWYYWEDGAAYLFTGRRTLKWRNLLRDPHASLCIDDRTPPYSSVVLEGTVEESDRSMYELVLKMALAYYGEEKGRPFAEGYRDKPDSVLFKLTSERIVSFKSDSY